MITLAGSPCQTLIAMIEGIASVGSATHRWGGIPNTPRSWLRRPPSGCRSRATRGAIAVADVTSGRKYAVRIHAIPRICWFRARGQAEGEDQAERHRDDRVEGRVAERLQEPIVAEERDVVVEAHELRRP